MGPSAHTVRKETQTWTEVYCIRDLDTQMVQSARSSLVKLTYICLQYTSTYGQSTVSVVVNFFFLDRVRYSECKKIT